MIVRRFEGKERWREIALDGTAVTLAFGPLDKCGVARTTVFPDEAAARAEYEAKVTGYLAAGMVELDEKTAAERRATLGMPRDLGRTTPAEEAAAEEARAARERERPAREAAARAREERGKARRELLEQIEARRKAREAARAAKVATDWPAPPRWLEQIRTGNLWGAIAHGSAVYTSSPMPGREPIDVHACASEDAARAEAERLIRDKLARGWVAIAPTPWPQPSILARRLPVLDGVAARAIVRRAVEAMPRGIRWREPIDVEAQAPFDPRREAKTFAAIAYLSTSTGDPQPVAALVDAWVAESDVDGALQALVSSTRLDVAKIGPDHVVTASSPKEWGPRWTAWQRLRRHPRDAMMATARVKYGYGDADLRCQILLAFPELRAIAIAAIEEHLALAELPPRAIVLLASASSPDHARRLAERVPADMLPRCAAWLEDLVDVAGAGAIDALEHLLGRATDPKLRRAIGNALGRILDPRAIAILRDGIDDPDLLPGAVTSALASPRSYVDRVAPAAASGGATGAIALALLTWMLRASSDPIAPRAPGPGAARAMRIATARARGPSEREPIGSDSIPAVLRDPPWRTGKRAARPVRVLPAIESAPRIEWPRDARSAWMRAEEPCSMKRDATCEEMFDRARESAATCDVALLLDASPSIALAAWKEIAPARWRGPAKEIARAFVARHELAAIDGLVAFANARPAEGLAACLPFDDPRIAPAAAAGLDDPAAEPAAREWLEAHPQSAARGLVPIAVGPPGDDRDRADRAIHALASQADVVLEVASSWSVADLVRPMLDHDPRTFAPEVPPALPAAWDASALPAPILVATGRALPRAAVEALGELLVLDARSRRPEIEAVRAACTPASLADLASEAAARWIAAGSESSEIAMLRAIARFGDDDGARLVSDLARRADDRHDEARAATMIDILAALASPIAVLHLQVLEKHARTAGIRVRAASAIAKLAGSSDVQAFADERIPDFGPLALDLGRRTLHIGFDERLEPFVTDASGERSRTLELSPDDDPERAADAEIVWRRMKRDAGAFASVMRARLEEAMIARRAIPLAIFESRYRAHPLVRHLSTGLVWQTEKGSTFRIAEDGSLADPDDAPFVLEGERVRVAHPAALDPDVVARWRSVFADYEIVQPFEQLDRPVHRLDPKTLSGDRLDRSGPMHPAEAMARLLRHFEHALPSGALIRPLPNGLSLVVGLDYGAAGSFRIAYLAFRGSDGVRMRLADIDAIDLSEAMVLLDRILD